MIGKIVLGACLAVVAFMVGATTLANFIAPYSPTDVNLFARQLPPFWLEGGSPAYPLGTDGLGRDILSRLIFGARYSLIVAVLAITIGAFLGTALGIIAGYYRGKVDTIIMRVTDAVMAFPTFLFALLLAVTLGASFTNIIVAIAAGIWSIYARTIRGEVLSLRERDFVAQARTIGCSNITIMIRHIFPNIFSTLVVLMTLQVGWAIMFESTLSFLGVGIPPPTPSWGRMVEDGRQYMGSAWWISFIPAMAILLVVLSFNMLGDSLRERLDPKLRQI